MTKLCKVESCDRAVRVRNMCKGHYSRWQKYGEPGHTPIKTAKFTWYHGKCSVDECFNVIKAHGFCNKHYMAFKREQSPPKVGIDVKQISWPLPPEIFRGKK